MSEIFRVSFQNIFEKLVYLLIFGFIIRTRRIVSVSMKKRIFLHKILSEKEDFVSKANVSTCVGSMEQFIFDCILNMKNRP